MPQSPTRLHIPDGFLEPWVAMLGWVLAVIVIAIALRQTSRQLAERQVPIMGVLAAFIFAAQAINFPVATGTSGHLLGGTLAAIALGPWAATLIMTAVIGVQAFLFQDGGLLALGWNILNMGVLTAFSGYLVYRTFGRLPVGGARMKSAAAFAGAWVSVEVGAIATSIELAVSGTSPLVIGLPAMATVHAIIGIGEGLITSGAISLLQVSRPEVLSAGERAPGRRSSAFVLGGRSLVLVIRGFSPLASSRPDGLEFVAGQGGFLDKALEPLYSILPDYTVPFIQNPSATTIAAVLFGALIVFVIAWVIGRRTAKAEG